MVKDSEILSYLPKKLKVKYELKSDIQAGKFGPSGTPFLPIRKLAKDYNVSLVTAQKVAVMLREEGILAQEGKSYTVAEKGVEASIGSKRKTWAVLVKDLQYYYPPIVETIEREARKLGITIELGCVGGDLDAERQMINQKIKEGVSGIILAPVQPYGPLLPNYVHPFSIKRPEGSLDYLGELPVPVVVVDHFGMDMPNVGVDCVLKDDFGGAYQSIAHLAQHGYHKIAYFHGLNPKQTSQPYESLQREKGFQAALDDYGLNVAGIPDLYIWHIKYEDWQVNYKDSPIYKSLKAGVEAFAFSDDGTAATFIRLLETWGVKVPDDVAVMGYDDDRICTLTSPTITSIRAPKEEMAQKAVQFLQERTESGSQSSYRSIVLKPTVVPRASCGKNCPLVRPLVGSAIPSSRSMGKRVIQTV